MPLSLENAIKIVGEFIEEYNSKRLHSAIGYITPNDKMAGKAEEIWQSRDEKLETARRLRKLAREKSREEVRNKQNLTLREAIN